MLTRCIAEEGVRVTIGTPEENDRFLEAFGAGELVDGLMDHWRLPTGSDAMRVHGWVQQLLDPRLQAGLSLRAASECRMRCEAVTSGSSAAHAQAIVDLRQVLHATADLLADAPAEALPRLELELAALLRGISWAR